jgi:hypothetical protein
MAKAKQASTRNVQLENRMTDLFIETLKEFAPGSTRRLINSSIELMEAHRELLAERIARLERIRARIAEPARTRSNRRVAVGTRRASRAKRASAA